AQALTHGTDGQLGPPVAAVLFPPAASGGAIVAPVLWKQARWREQVPMVLVAGIAGALLYGRVAVWLFELAVRRFEREWEAADRGRVGNVPHDPR
ncbi:MAG TPA: hypothetical protein VMZ71_06860, partial [Gemmataceae bacterium]|nr:hypothetical protein [Gemmataceae bacterium]